MTTTQAATTPHPASSRQGGDLRPIQGRHRSHQMIDLGTCVNPYGPPPAVTHALTTINHRQLRTHPYEAADHFTTHYAAYLGVNASDLVVGAGISGLLAALTAAIPTKHLATVTPDYTEIIQRIPHHHPPTDPAVPDTPGSRLIRIHDALTPQGTHVIISNPCNPTGTLIPPADLERAAMAHPDSTLIIDESYVEFTNDPNGSTLLGTDVPNILVLRSPSKPFGIAGTRCGAAWTHNHTLRSKLATQLPNWPLSVLDTSIATAAIEPPETIPAHSGASWLTDTTASLREVATVMELMLSGIPDVTIIPSPTHFRCLLTPSPERIYDHLDKHGIATRIFDPTQPGRLSGIRIAAPHQDVFPKLKEALTNLHTAR